ncbi:MAG: hypothetical protein AB9900_00375 [Humidesulfovibrio sp.]
MKSALASVAIILLLFSMCHASEYVCRYRCEHYIKNTAPDIIHDKYITTYAPTEGGAKESAKKYCIEWMQRNPKDGYVYQCSFSECRLIEGDSPRSSNFEVVNSKSHYIDPCLDRDVCSSGNIIPRIVLSPSSHCFIRNSHYIFMLNKGSKDFEFVDNLEWEDAFRISSAGDRSADNSCQSTVRPADETSFEFMGRLDRVANPEVKIVLARLLYSKKVLEPIRHNVHADDAFVNDLFYKEAHFEKKRDWDATTYDEWITIESSPGHQLCYAKIFEESAIKPELIKYGLHQGYVQMARSQKIPFRARLEPTGYFLNTTGTSLKLKIIYSEIPDAIVKRYHNDFCREMRMRTYIAFPP